MADEKILKDEVLSDEELDGVAGGNCRHTANDSKLLYDYGLIDDWHGSLHTAFHWQITHDEAVAHVKANFQKIRSHDD